MSILSFDVPQAYGRIYVDNSEFARIYVIHNNIVGKYLKTITKKFI